MELLLLLLPLLFFGLPLLPMRAVRLQLGILLAADTTTLAPAGNANKIALVVAPFTINETMDLSSLVLATFTGGLPIPGAAGTQGSGIDPVTGAQLVTILAPAGGWRWVCTVAPTPAQTVYGYVLVDDAVAVLLGAATLPVPQVVSQLHDVVDLGAVMMQFVAQPAS